jgi:FKBP-type peptidyl-prolyl cis-trans isomerase 2
MRSEPILLILILFFLAGCAVLGEKVEIGDTVTVDYVGALENGEIFDTSLKAVAEDPGLPKMQTFSQRRVYTPFKFKVGSGSVIKGFEEGVIGMREGDEKTVQIPPEDGYGNRIQEKIAPLPKNYKVTIFEEFEINKLSKETGIEQFTEGERIPHQNGRPWNATIYAVLSDSVMLKNDIQNFNETTNLGTLIITRDVGEITVKLMPTLNSYVNTPLGTAKIDVLNETHYGLDFNHPLAGETLIFNITLKTIEKANQ